MHKGWWMVVVAYLLLLMAGVLAFALGDRNPGDNTDPGCVGAEEWKPEPRPDAELLIITLDDSSTRLAQHLKKGDHVRVCVTSETRRRRPIDGWCGPPLEVAGVTADPGASPWLALYVPTQGFEDTLPYIVAENKVVLYVAAAAEASADTGGGAR